MTALPLPFAALLVGRAGQGVGLGLTALMMGVARDHLPHERSTRTIALVSVASTAGIGVGYPLAGLLTDVDGIRASYAFGLIVTTAAWLVAILVIPAAPKRRASRVDIPGALLLTVALVGLLTMISETELWRLHTVLAAAVFAGAPDGDVVGWAEATEARPRTRAVKLRFPSSATLRWTPISSSS